MFSSILDKHPIIVLKDIKGEVFEALLKYMYLGEVNVVQDRLSDLINAAECLKIKGLAVPDEDPSDKGVRSVSGTRGGQGTGKRRHDQTESSGSVAPPSKVHKPSSINNKSVPNTSSSNNVNRSFEAKNKESIRKSRSSREDGLFPEEIVEVSC